jgi:hypothetical protein
MVRVQDAGLDSSIEEQEYFEQLFDVLYQLKEERE